jgi:hypothetical protein
VLNGLRKAKTGTVLRIFTFILRVLGHANWAGALNQAAKNTVRERAK